MLTSTLRNPLMTLRRGAAALRRRIKRGVTLIELIAVAVILGIFALIVVPNVTNALGTAKTAAFQSTISELQSASDQFYAVNSVYPTYDGAYASGAIQPTTTAAAEIQPTAQDVADSNTFLPNYIRTAPMSKASQAGLSVSNGANVYYGLDAAGQVFATESGPHAGTWTLTTDGTDQVYTAQYPTGKNSSGTYTLSMLAG